MQRCFFLLVVFLSLHVTGAFPVRLIGGPNLCAGRVEIFHQGQWGTVCDDDWDMRDAAVVCRELDCGEALSAPHGAWFGEGPGPIWLNEVRCAGTEWHLHSCHHLGFRKHVCTHEEDASVICSEQRFPPFTSFPPHTTFRRGKMDVGTTARPVVSPTPAQGAPALRLVGGRSHCSGRVEVFHEGQWGTVCDDMWDLLDVAVVCRELDCGEALAAPGGAFFGEGNSVIWLDDVQCQGEEPALKQCHTSSWGTNNCRHSEDAGAVCSGEMPLAMVEEHVAMLTRTLAPQRFRTVAPRRIPRPTRPSITQEEPVANEASHAEKRLKGSLSERVLNGQWQVRLVGGPGSCAGRVEVLYKDHWGTVCDDGWDLVDAAVVCRELGCGAPLLSPGNARYGPGSGPIWLDDVNCTGSEFTLRRCRSQPWGKHNCNHHEDASVICTGKWKRLSLLKPSSDSAKSTTTISTTTATTTITPTTTITTTAQNIRPVDGPELQSTLDVPETTRTTQTFLDELEKETLQSWHTDNPLRPIQNEELELEQNTMVTSPTDTAEITPSTEIVLLSVQEMESTSTPERRPTTYKWVKEATDETTPDLEILQRVQKTSSTKISKTKSYMNKWKQEPNYVSTETQPSSNMLDLESKREREMHKTIVDLQTLQNGQGIESVSSPKNISPHKWEQKATYATTVSQPPSTILDFESKRDTITHTPMNTTTPDLEILQNGQEMELTSSPKSTTPHIWEQHSTYATTTSQLSSTMVDMESKRDTTTHMVMDRTVTDLEILKNGEEMESSSSPKTISSPHEWQLKPTSSSTEFLSPFVIEDLESETEAESTTPSEMDLPTVTDTDNPATDMEPPIHWSNMSKVPHITQDVEPINAVAEAQPTTWIKDREATDNLGKELIQFSKRLEATMAIELPTATENMQPVQHMETTYPKVPDSKENTSQKQQEGSNKNLHAIQPTEFTPSDVTSLDETDAHNTTKWPQSPVSHTVSPGGQTEDGLESSGDTERETNFTDIVSTPSMTKALRLDISSDEAVASSAKLSESPSGCPIRQEQKQEHQDFCCSSPAVRNLVQAMEGLRGDLGSLSTTIQHQGSQMEAVAFSLAELAASVRYLVQALPTLRLQPSVQSPSAPHRQDEDQR
ncbi:soluble scavenger receptor cysteine-rich domain-containing protein SSC5D [Anolis carolinensis]|uniref:SRCR domain-containing protein n=1 Tax=Anolis carolinensis TaxID=28377 RepID=A0A803U1N3_ANOCA|nr:PREDICTED: soluble scavenger receptor cysteine-rich domain-containing protein SSC5D [Anolis carolinensis]|eukprot:XP_003224554.2 PREDICTED: soluble scavenger receptor cysteine-rich domain-containing protein SSC5D [Anolis carolinensis]